MKQKKHSERITILEHEIQGNGSIGIKDQLKFLRKEIATIKHILYTLVAIFLLLFGEKIYELLKHLI